MAWIGYTVPVVDGERVMCCFGNDTTWVNGNVVMSTVDSCCGACRLEPASDGSSMATRAPAASRARPARVKLEGSDRMVVLFRVADRAVERIRVFSEDCQLDAGGRPVHWLENVRPADSIALLESFATSRRRPARSHHRRRDHRDRAARRPGGGRVARSAGRAESAGGRPQEGDVLARQHPRRAWTRRR